MAELCPPAESSIQEKVVKRRRDREHARNEKRKRKSNLQKEREKEEKCVALFLLSHIPSFPRRERKFICIGKKGKARAGNGVQSTQK